MRAFLVTTIIGCFAVDENNKIILFKPFPKNPEKIAERLRLSEKEIVEEEKRLQTELWKKGYREFVFSVRKPGARKVEPGNRAEQFVKENLRDLAINYNFVKDRVEFNNLLSNVNIEIAKKRIKVAIGKDSLVIQIVRIIEDLDKSINILMERLREFYSLHFPELDRLEPDHRKYAKIVEKYGLREKIEESEFRELAKKSMGADFTEDEMKAVQSIASKILEIYELKDNLSKELEKMLKEIAPNFTDLAGPMLSAKLIAKAGGLEKLAKMPSSAIQLMGAEKSLFRFLHGKGRSPRFGIIYNHPLILNAPEKLKGKVARVLSSKLSIAAKLDFYSKEYKGDKLKKDLEERMKKILSSKP
jgi:nucleolar protein 56